MEIQNDFILSIPEMNDVEQGEEYFVISYDGEKEKIQFHDYARIYKVPGLYEDLFYDRYKCNSPEVVCGLLKEQLDRQDVEDRPLKVLDVGAGNGMVGEQLVASVWMWWSVSTSSKRRLKPSGGIDRGFIKTIM